MNKKKKGDRLLFSLNSGEFPFYVCKDILQVGLMNQAPTILKKGDCPLFFVPFFEKDYGI